MSAKNQQVKTIQYKNHQHWHLVGCVITNIFKKVVKSSKFSDKIAYFLIKILYNIAEIFCCVIVFLFIVLAIVFKHCF